MQKKRKSKLCMTGRGLSDAKKRKSKLCMTGRGLSDAKKEKIKIMHDKSESDWLKMKL